MNSSLSKLILNGNLPLRKGLAFKGNSLARKMPSPSLFTGYYFLFHKLFSCRKFKVSFSLLEKSPPQIHRALQSTQITSGY
ncbi:hypothetical protein NEOC65_001884 [Neochlamydia sp. AcF65]|nr:hypothetical protein [Neochlamydia sp. AcF65]